MDNFDYSREQLVALYQLGRLYYRMGYYAPAERIFHGILAMNEEETAARIGLGLIKLERGAFKDSAEHFRKALENSHFKLQSKIGLATTFIAEGEEVRARSLLEEIDQQIDDLEKLDPGLRKLLDVLFRCCE